MTSQELKENDLSAFGDEAIVKEAASRLQKAFKNQFGFPMKFGSFQLVFHNGKFEKVEDQFRHRRYFPAETRTEGDK